MDGLYKFKRIFSRWNGEVFNAMLKQVAVLAFTLLVFSEGSNSMSISGVWRSCVFSGVKVVVLQRGKPVVGAEVTRISEWQKQKLEKTVTDSRGQFSFPDLFESSLAGIMPFTEFVASQQILVRVGTENFVIWANGKRSAKKNSELGGIPLELVCELNDNVRLVEEFGSLLVTNCRW